MDKKRILLIRFPYSTDIYKVYKTIEKNREVRPPLSLMYIGASLESKGHEVKIIDAEPELMTPFKIREEAINYSPDWIGFTSTTPEFLDIYTFISILKRNMPHVKIMVGGAHVSSVPYIAQTFRHIDFVIVGEGEIAVVDVVEGNLSDEERKTRTVSRPLIKDLDNNVLPARHLVDYSKYKFPVPGKGLKKMDAIESARGCPFSCDFCYQRKTEYRTRSIFDILFEIELSILTYGTEFFMFFDDTFTVNNKRAQEICKRIISSPICKNVKFYANLRANTYQEETTLLMKKAGFIEMSMGIESGNQEILDNIHKGTVREQYVSAYKSMKKIGVQTRGSFIIGFPYETEKTIQTSINFAKSLDLERISVNILTPYPGTIMYDKAMKGEGLYLMDNNWRHFKRWGMACVRTPSLSRKDLEEWQKTFLTEFYSSPKVVWYHILQLLKGNFSYYYYRPVIFALKEKILKIIIRRNHED